MSKGSAKETDINKNKRDSNANRKDPNLIQVKVNDGERELYLKVASILSQIQVRQPDGNIGTLIPDKSLRVFTKSALSFMTNVFLAQVFGDSRIAANFANKEALNEFVTFRARYMHFPVDKQIEDLKRAGVVKSSSN